MRRMLCWGAAPVAALVIALAPPSAAAQTCPSPAGEGAAVAALDPGARYRFIEAELDREAGAGRLWNRVWGWGLLGTAVGQAGIGALVPDDQCPQCWYLGAGKSLLGAGSTAVLDPVRIRAVPDVGSAPTCDQVAAAEAALMASAASEQVHWYQHVEGLAVNLAASLYMGFELDEWGKAALSFAVGSVVGELRLYTRPEGAIRALHHYRQGELAARDRAATTWVVMPAVGRGVVGLSLAFGF